LVYSVDTPENVRLSFVRAGLATRAIAFCIDLGAMAALLQCVAWLLAPFESIAGSAAGALWIIAGFVIQWSYGVLCEWRYAGRTLGKRICGIAVVDASGLPLSLPQAATRNLLRVVDLLPGLHLVGALASLLDPHGRRLGDLAARTVVVRDPRATPPRLEARATSPGAGTRRADADDLARRMNGEERTALRALCVARETLPLAERNQLCGALAAHLAARYGAPIPAHLSGEKFLLLIHDALSNGSQRSDSLSGRSAPLGATSRTGPRRPGSRSNDQES
jgi:uncharacterized RDD family membrane protein YckC